jgi:NADH:ubiquinone oxidoreductase subunit 3 (subunit A)
MSEIFFRNFFLIALLAVSAAAFGIAALVLARLVAPRKPSASKNATYECGLESEGDSWIQFRIQYYVYALIFVIFDVEVIFLYPWAVAFRDLQPEAFGAAVFFILILFLGLAYEWRKKTLEWE